MKFSTVSSLVASALYVTAVSAFVQLPPAATRTPHLYATTSVELVAEPDGGVELKKVSDASLPGSRMKNMPFTQYFQTSDPLLKGAVDGSEEGVHSFWLSVVADGQKIKELRVQTEKEASKKANFPGFRKGQIPPYAQSRMTMFAIQEAVIKTCEQSLEAYGLESLTGSEGEVTVYEDMQKVCKGYKLGDDIPFTATYKGKFDKAVQSSVSSAGGDSAAAEVDVEAEVVAE
ncbi:hypothetical protein ACHAWX_006967 [Stephanocyclus meneghinianus]